MDTQTLSKTNESLVGTSVTFPMIQKINTPAKIMSCEVKSLQDLKIPFFSEFFLNTEDRL